MSWYILTQIISTILTFIRIGRSSEAEKDLEILVLRQQLAILQRKLDKPLRPEREEKIVLALLTARLKQVSQKSTNITMSLGLIKGLSNVFQLHSQ